MKTKYLLTLFAKPNVDGSVQYSNTIEPIEDNPQTGCILGSHNFADETELVQMVNAVLPNGGNINYRMERLKSEGHYTIECVPEIKMTDEQAAEFGWIP